MDVIAEYVATTWHLKRAFVSGHSLVPETRCRFMYTDSYDRSVDVGSVFVTRDCEFVSLSVGGDNLRANTGNIGLSLTKLLGPKAFGDLMVAECVRSTIGFGKVEFKIWGVELDTEFIEGLVAAQQADQVHA
jgi:hypothetical protein